MRNLKILSLGTILFLVAIACENKTGTIPPNQLLKAIPVAFSDQTTVFAFDFLKQHDTEEKADKNYFVSPLSLQVALGMLVNGAEGKTKEEILTSLGASTDLLVNNKFFKDLIENLPNSDPKVVNKIANSVWYRNTFLAEKDFLDILKLSFNSQIYAENFDNIGTVDRVNAWASDNTNGKINKVLDKIDPSHVMFLMNALYFKGDWKIPFKVENTRDINFEGITDTKPVKMMYMTESIKYANLPDYQAIELAYGSGNYVMTILLPNQKSSIGAILATLSGSEWKNLNASFSEQKVAVGLPKFTMAYEAKLKGVLNKMGMPTMFSESANLSKISPPEGKLKVGSVQQNTFISVDEKGTEAAAVTTIQVGVTSVPTIQEFTCNRPFAFFISEKQSNTILFIGKVVNL